MDIISFNEAATANGRIEIINANPDSTSGIVTVPKTIASGETVTVPTGRVAVLPNVQVDGTLNVEGEVFIPSGSSVDFSNGIKVNGEKLTMSIPTAYHIYNGSVEATNTILTNGFSTTLYTGNGSTQDVVTGVDMATQWGDDASETFGGLVWCKNRSANESHSLYDTIRGANNVIQSNSTIANTTTSNDFNSFNSDGYTVGVVKNTNAATYASWNFQTTHRVSGTTNHGKAYTCHYNPFTGFTIIKYEGSGLSGHEIPHHLGRKLGFVIQKDLIDAVDWITYNGETGSYMSINTTAGKTLDSSLTMWRDVIDTSISLGTHSNVNENGKQHILYGWANSYFDESNKLIGNYEIGVYQGTGVAGNKVTTRGKPALVMVKRLDAVSSWYIYDNQREVAGQRNSLRANSSGAEDNSIATSYAIEIINNGFIPTGNTDAEDNNLSGGQYLYMVVYDNDSGSGKSKYPKATDTTNLSINALVPYANGIDVNGSKVSIEYKNETIAGLTLTQGKNYVYSKNDGTYSVSKYEPMYGSLRNRSVAGENPDYFDLKTMKWYGTTGEELVTNGTFDVDTTGWTGINATLSVVNQTLRITTTGNYGGAYHTLTNLVVGKKYRYVLSGSLVTATQFLIRVGVPPFSNGYDYQSAWQTSSGVVYLDFVALYTTMAIECTFGTTTGVTGSIDNISVFEVEPTIDAEITPRTYLDCVVYADQNGQVSYVEELPKTTYIPNLKVTDGFDLGQTWQNVIASRIAGVTYTNTTGKPIEVIVRGSSSGAYPFYVNGTIVSYLGGSAVYSAISITVPDGFTYILAAGASVNQWSELR